MNTGDGSVCPFPPLPVYPSLPKTLGEFSVTDETDTIQA